MKPIKNTKINLVICATLTVDHTSGSYRQPLKVDWARSCCSMHTLHKTYFRGLCLRVTWTSFWNGCKFFFVFFTVCVDKWNYYVIFCWRCRPLLRSTGSYILCVIGNLKDPVVVWSSVNSEYISGLSWNTLLRMEVCFYYLMTAS